MPDTPLLAKNEHIASVIFQSAGLDSYYPKLAVKLGL
jgi:hypothetical protein